MGSLPALQSILKIDLRRQRKHIDGAHGDTSVARVLYSLLNRAQVFLFHFALSERMAQPEDSCGTNAVVSQAKPTLATGKGGVDADCNVSRSTVCATS